MDLGSIVLVVDSVLIRFKTRCLALGRLFNYFKLGEAGEAGEAGVGVGEAGVGEAGEDANRSIVG